jgi:hypothetical protein
MHFIRGAPNHQMNIISSQASAAQVQLQFFSASRGVWCIEGREARRLWQLYGNVDEGTYFA